MTSREQVLVGGAAAVAVIFGGFQIVKSYVITPRLALQQEIRDEQLEQIKLLKELRPAAKAKSAWAETTAVTFRNDQQVGPLDFRSEITSILKKQDLDKVAVLTPRPSEVINKGPRAGLRTLRVGLKFDATMPRTVGFLKDLYAAPFVKRVDSLGITAPANEVKPKRSDKPSADPTLGITMMISTLTLPQANDEKLAATPYQPGSMPEDWKSPLEEAPYLVANADYERVWRDSVFKLTVPPKRPPPPKPPEPKKPDPPAVAKKEPKREPKPEPKREPPPDPRPDADMFTLIGSASEEGQPVAYVFDDSSLDPPLEFRLNDKMDDGRVVLIDPRCVVIRSSLRKPSGDPKFFIYGNGRTFADRAPLTAKNYPEIWTLVQEVLAHSAAQEDPTEPPASQPEGESS